MLACRLCSLEKKLIKAHAIPEAFFRELRTDRETPLLITSVQGNFPKRASIGVYDEEILCEVCEPLFGKVDDYGIDVFLKKFETHFQPLQRGEQTVGFESHTVDPKRLLQFLVAVLWRASVSAQPFYAKVDLGPHESAARESALRSDYDVPETFDAVLSRWSDVDERIPTTAFLDPHREKLFGINAYRLYLGRMVADVKVDKQPFPRQLQAFSLRTAPHTLVVARDMAESKDLRALKQTVQRSHRNMTEFQHARRATRGAA